MTAAILVAAGRGTRMGPKVDKLFLEVAGAPIVAHTWRRLDVAGFDEIVVVARAGMAEAFQELASSLPLTTPWHLACGGSERQDSVWNGLQAVSAGNRWVAIQDGARPCTAVALIRQCLEVARRMGASVAAQRVVDTMKESADGRHITNHLDRTKLWSVQTPQCFQLAILLRALTEVRQRGLCITDDTAACEYIGQAVELVPSTQPNPKVTAPDDLPWIEYLLKRDGLEKSA